ncbi:class I adenylate-forming enzyme family protein [Nonomuraea sp. NPDC001699]
MNTLAALTRNAHERYAGHRAVHDGSAWLTFAALGARATAVAARLRRRGLNPGDRVVIALRNRAEILQIEHALFLSGLVRVAVSNRLHGREIAGIARDCAAALVLCEPEHVVALDRPHISAAELGELTAPGPELPEVPEPDPGDVAALMYTSGTTGEPKGAIVTHRQWLAMVGAIRARLPVRGPGDVVVHVAPMSHFGGSIGSAYTFSGAAAVPLPTYGTDAVLGAVEEFGATVLPLVPTMLKELTTAVELGRYRLGSLSAVPYGGAAISAPSAVRAAGAFGEVLYQCYGLSEALAPLTVLPPEAHMRAGDPRLTSAGRPVPGVEIKIIDAVGGIGEVAVRGASVMPGYWNRPEQSAEVLDQERWFRTGDIGRLDEDGYLHLVDRRRDVIVSGGFNVYPGEVERAISELPDVREVVVFGIPHERWGEAVAAAVVVAPGSRLTGDDVVQACRDRLAGYKKPLKVDLVAELPMSSTGKINRREVRDRYWSVRSRNVGD